MERSQLKAKVILALALVAAVQTSALSSAHAIPVKITRTSATTPSPTPTIVPAATSTPLIIETQAPIPSPTEIPTFSASATPSETPTPTFTATPTAPDILTLPAMDQPSPTATSTAAISEPPTPAPSETPTSVPADTPTETPSEAPTETPIVVWIETPTPTPSETPTYAPTYTPTEAPTETPSVAWTETPMPAPSETPTYTPSDAPTEVPTETPSPMTTETPTPTPNEPPTYTPTDTPTEVPTETPTPSETATDTPTATPAETPTDSPTESPTPSPTMAPTSSPTEAPTTTPTPCATCPPLQASKADFEPPLTRPDPDRFRDDDADGVINEEEDAKGTARDNADTDGDEYSDAEELYADRISQMLPSDPTDPMSIPNEPLPEGYGRCLHVDRAPPEPTFDLEALLEIEEDTGEDSESMCAVGGARTSTPKRDEALFQPYRSLGRGIAAKPCEKRYTYCITTGVAADRTVRIRNWVTTAFKIWLKNMRNCISECPEISETEIVQLDTCEGVNLEVTSIGGSTSWGEVTGVGSGKIQIGDASPDSIIVHEIGHAMGLDHVADYSDPDLYWNGTLAAGDPHASVSPIMSYGYMSNRPHPICLHPSDAKRICQLVSQDYVVNTEKRVCGKEKDCCLESAAEKEIVGDAKEGRNRVCYTTVKPKPGEELLPTTETRCHADADMCMACKDSSGKTIPWQMVSILDTNKGSRHFGECYAGPYCPTIDKWYPEIGRYYPPKKDAAGRPTC